MFHFNRKTDQSPGVRGTGKRVISTATGIEGKVVIPSASASIASCNSPMSETAQKNLLDLVRNPKPEPPIKEQKELALLIHNVLVANPKAVEKLHSERERANRPAVSYVGYIR